MQNIDIDTILYRLEFGISNRAILPIGLFALQWIIKPWNGLIHLLLVTYITTALLTTQSGKSSHSEGLSPSFFHHKHYSIILISKSVFRIAMKAACAVKGLTTCRQRVFRTSHISIKMYNFKPSNKINQYSIHKIYWYQITELWLTVLLQFKCRISNTLKMYKTWYS